MDARRREISIYTGPDKTYLNPRLLAEDPRARVQTVSA